MADLDPNGAPPLEGNPLPEPGTDSVRRPTPTDRNVRLWNSLEIAKLMIAGLLPISVFVATAVLSRAAQEEARKDREFSAINQFSRSAMERRTRLEMTVSAIKRHAQNPTDHSFVEIHERKAAYDQAYIYWNTHLNENMLTLRHAIKSADYSDLESMVQHSLINSLFQPADACLTSAVDKSTLTNALPAVEILKKCNMDKLRIDALNCIYRITDSAYRAVKNGSYVHDPLDERCPRKST